MGQIGRFIDRCVEHEPELMQRVLERPWGTLSEFVSFDEEGEVCGCLVGSIGIEGGARVSRDTWASKNMQAVATRAAVALRGPSCGDSYEYESFDEAEAVGSAVWNYLAWRLSGRDSSAMDEAELLTVAMLKRRIARRLRERRGTMTAPISHDCLTTTGGASHA